MKFFAVWGALCLLFVVYRMWAGGCFETGLESFLGWTKAHED